MPMVQSSIWRGAIVVVVVLFFFLLASFIVVCQVRMMQLQQTSMVWYHKMRMYERSRSCHRLNYFQLESMGGAKKRETSTDAALRI